VPPTGPEPPPPASALPGTIDPPRPAPVAVRRRFWLVVGAVALGLAAVLTLVWGLGGFERRTDLLRPTPPGTLITVGPYEFTFVEVTAQRVRNFDDTSSWKLTAIGSGRTTADESLAPRPSGGSPFASQDPRSGEVEAPTGVRYGEAASFVDGARFTPGLPPKPILVEFTYRDSYRPDATLRFVVFQLELVDDSLLRDQDPTWSTTNRGFDFRLPVRVLAPASS
jgi:hypothetical protein